MMVLAGTLVLAFFVQKPALALILGMLFGLFSPYEIHSAKTLSKKMLQGAVILLGFGVSIQEVIHVGASSFGLTLFSITLTMVVGYLLNRLFRCELNTALLICAGTAICGGSAIAAIAPVLGATAVEIAMAIGVVFFLNSLGLLVFPGLGHWLGFTPEQFGTWAALAIHDTSSVVGAAAAYHVDALGIATTIKLVRALWILPLAFCLSRIFQREGKAGFPWFLLGFLGAAGLAYLMPEQKEIWLQIRDFGKIVMVGTLFLIGSTMKKATLAQLAGKPLFLAVSLWVLVSGVSAWGIHSGLIY